MTVIISLVFIILHGIKYSEIEEIIGSKQYVHPLRTFVQ